MSLPPYSTRPTLRVDLSTLKSNYEALKTLVPRAKVAASVKADAYGLGLETVGRALYGAGCRIFFVATAGEGKLLREAIGPNGAIYVLNGPAPRDKAALLGAKLKPVINSIEQARYWAEVCREVNDPPFTAIHIDTGMNRLGMSEDDVAMLASDKGLWKTLNPDWVMSHLACAPDVSHPLNAVQLQRFKRLAATLPPTPLSFANSAGIYLGKDYHFQMVRPGISLYGGFATSMPGQEVTKPVVKLLAPILQLRTVKAGESIGYDASFTADRDMRIATVGAGYADGVPIALSNQGQAVIHDQSVPIIGRVSMDITLLDVTDLHLPVQVGGVAIFLGDHLEDQAAEGNTINYELLVRIGQRVRRDYWKPKSDRDDTDRTQTSRPQHSKKPGPKRSASKKTDPKGSGFKTSSKPSGRKTYPNKGQRSPGR
ncbi:alanine racemase [Algimonas porphyrae]|uniref:Alanine racemase n=1 Tax=Algimonas porphyrae TaxID=1128113 RepID=A0ABQ5UZ39_9PROT|nr:alanine racemase [Algimonas porphyrae]GLQ19252.1 alanine racemase, catabolic [Algimonas porphyrae]